MTVDSGSGGKDQAPDAVPEHGLQQGERMAKVVLIVLRRPGHRFPYLNPSGEMHHGGDVLGLKELV